MQRLLSSVNGFGISDTIPVILRVINTSKGTENMQSTSNSAVELKKNKTKNPPNLR